MNEKLIGALENEKWDWRTIDGLVKETNLDRTIIEQQLVELGQEGIVVQAVNPTTHVPVFTTRKHYNSSRSFLEKSLSGFTGHIQY